MAKNDFSSVFGFAKKLQFSVRFSFTKLTAVLVLQFSIFALHVVLYFRAELVQLAVSRNDSELEVQRYGKKKNTLTVDPITLEDEL